MNLLSSVQRQYLLNRFPCKAAWDAMALAQIFLRGNVVTRERLSFSQKMDCLKFYFDPAGVRRLVVSSPRSGARWSHLAIELAMDLQRGGHGEYIYEFDHFWPENGQRFARLDWRLPTGTWVKTHEHPSTPVIDELDFLVAHITYGQIRTCRVPEMDIVMITRSIPAVLASLFTKFSRIEDQTGTSLENENSFDWEWFTSKLIDYYNSWGDVMTWHRSIRHYKYEDIKADPLGTHLEMLDFWGIKIDEANMAEGLFRASKTEMLKRMPAEDHATNVRISTADRKSRRVIPEGRLKWIIERLNRELKHDFGYRYDMDTPYDTAYD